MSTDPIYLKATTVTGNAWEYDVRLIFEASQILLEISAINDQLGQEIKAFLALFGQYVQVDVIDDDGEQTTW
ncbi:hypothetical protein [Acinetobacter sp. Tol 5]|uniref:hypothetical protein n=1 Tax=Acinetobacter sp. (strain Tol 5) TaxID=710648 RepID=UPI001C77E459|nr:hypothetical protein [Acinetobacter sp. Tol 5]BCX74322.1 hypothetical protein TOL5_25220 [Acinetobacter sp. Tol 5]